MVDDGCQLIEYIRPKFLPRLDQLVKLRDDRLIGRSHFQEWNQDDQLIN